MLELNKFFTHKIEDLQDIFTTAFVIIDDIYNDIAATYIRKCRNIKDVILSDKCQELIVIHCI